VNLFGQTLDSQALFALISLSATLVLWLLVLRRERGYQRWLKLRRRERAPPPSQRFGGPWG
jgi:hypothetical protein